MIYRGGALVAAFFLLAFAVLCIGCGPKGPPPPGGAFTDLSRPGTDVSSAAARSRAGGAVPVAFPPAMPPRGEQDAAAGEQEIDDYRQRAREYEQQQDELRQQELESAEPSDMWVPIPEEVPEAEEAEPAEEESGGYAAY